MGMLFTSFRPATVCDHCKVPKALSSSDECPIMGKHEWVLGLEEQPTIHSGWWMLVVTSWDALTEHYQPREKPMKYWRVSASWPANKGLDTSEAEKAVGLPISDAGMGFGLRDVGWTFSDHDEATDAMIKLHGAGFSAAIAEYER